MTEPGHVIDLMATCVDVADAVYPKTFEKREVQPMEGVSLAPAFNAAGKDTESFSLQREQPLFFEHEGNRAIRDGKWKLVMLRKGDWELYDLETDRTELNDLAAEQPERVEKMEGMWQDWAKRANVLRDKE